MDERLNLEEKKIELDVETTQAINKMVVNQKECDNSKFEEIISSAKNSEGYMLGLTLKNEGELNHFFIVKSFYDGDILKSLKEIKELAIKKLEE